jgi:hypothetical protein
MIEELEQDRFEEGDEVICLNGDMFPFAGYFPTKNIVPYEGEILIVGKFSVNEGIPFLSFEKYNTDQATNWFHAESFVPTKEANEPIDQLIKEQLG